MKKNGKERWKKIDKADGMYAVSNLGRIRRIKLSRQLGHIMAIGRSKHNKYRQVRLCIKQGHKYFYVHRLVAEAFIGPCPEGKEVNHKDLNKGNNHYKNLEYITHEKNIQHAKHNGVKFGQAFKGIGGENHPCSKLTSREVKAIRKLYKTGNHRQVDLAKQFNITQVRISQIIRKLHWKEEI